MRFITTNRGVRNQVIEKINDPRLSTDMKRTRSGRTQLFRRDYGDRNFTSEENADVVLRHPQRHFYAEMVDGEWHWVNGCCECNGEKRDWVNSYIECEKHDVCSSCGIPRAQAKTCWGRKVGWYCDTCKQQEHDDRKHEYLSSFDEEEFDEEDYRYLDTPKCPYCNFQLEDPPEYWGESKDIKCPCCDHTYAIEAETTYTYHATRKGPKETA